MNNAKLFGILSKSLAHISSFLFTASACLCETFHYSFGDHHNEKSQFRPMTEIIIGESDLQNEHLNVRIRAITALSGPRILERIRYAWLSISDNDLCALASIMIRSFTYWNDTALRTTAASETFKGRIEFFSIKCMCLF